MRVVTAARNPRIYCNVDKNGKPIKLKPERKPVKIPSMHGERKYKRRTKVELETEARAFERDRFLLFLEDDKKKEKEEKESKEKEDPPPSS